MKTPTSLVHERIDDVPLLIGLAQKLRLPEANYSPNCAPDSCLSRLPRAGSEFALTCTNIPRTDRRRDQPLRETMRHDPAGCN